MAIESFKIITVEEYKKWDGFDEFMASKPELIQNQDNYISEAITTASSQINILSGGRIRKEFPFLDKENDINIINDIKLACCYQVRFLLRKGIEYLQENGNQVSTSALNYTINNSDTFAPRPDIIELLKPLGYYIDIKYINNSNEEPSYNYKNCIPSIYTDGTHRGLTYAEASGYFIKKVGGIVSDTGTIEIKDAPRPSDNGVSVSIDLTSKALQVIAPEVAKIVTPILVNDEQFQQLVIEGIKLYLNENKTTIGELAGDYLKDNQEFLNSLANNELILNKVKETVNNLEPQLQKNIEENLLNNKEWLDKVAASVPPINQESFNNLLKTSNFEELVKQIKIKINY